MKKVKADSRIIAMSIDYDQALIEELIEINIAGYLIEQVPDLYIFIEGVKRVSKGETYFIDTFRLGCYWQWH